MQPRTRIEFPPFRLDLANHELWRGDTRVGLRPKPFALLAYLASHPNRLVPHAELAKQLWPDTHVGDGLLRGYVRDVRAVLEDDPAAPRFIETVARLGYRFLAPVRSGPGRAPVPSALATSPPSDLVGRAAQLDALDAHLARALEGARQMVFLTGEPGIGKTALVDAFLARVGRETWCARGQCVEHFGPSEAYLPFLEWLGRLGRMPLREDLASVLVRHAPTWLLQVPVLVADADREALRLRAQGATRDRMLREFVEAVDALAALRPLIVVLEDLQWSDHATLDLLTAVARRRAPARLLVLCTYRAADVAEAHPLGAITRELRLHGLCEEIAVPPLGVGEVAEYLRQRNPPAADGVDLARAVHRATDGNPLFVVNLLDDWIDRGVLVQGETGWRWDAALAEGDGHVPDTVRQIIERQLGRLTPETRQLLEAGSVVGREFSAATVAAALAETHDEVERRCDDLAARGMVLRARGVDEAGGEPAGRYEFLHTLHRQVLYERLGAARRVRLHRRVGDWMASAYGERARERAAEIAMHFERGHDERAVDHLATAAENALGKHAYGEAAGSARRALAVLRARPDAAGRAREELSLQMALGTALVTTQGYAAPEVEAAFARAGALARDADAGPELVFALAGLFRFAFARARFAEARAIGQQVLRLAERGAPVLLPVAHCMIGPPLLSRAELVPAREHLERAIALYDVEQSRAIALQHGDDPALTALAFLSIALWFLGHPDQARARSREGLALAQRLATPYGVAFASSFCTWVEVRRGDVASVRAESESLAALAAEQGFPFFRAEAAVFRGWALAADGEAEAGVTQIRAGLSAHRAAGVELGRPSHLALLAEALSRAGRLDEALAVVDEALAMAAATEERCYEADFHRLKGEVLHRKAAGRRGALATRAEEAVHEALAIARRQGARSLELRAAVALCRLGPLHANPARARRALRALCATFDEGAETADLRAARAVLAASR